MSVDKQMTVVVGQRVFIANYSPTRAKAKYFVVSKVGRKYFEVEGLPRKRFLVANNTDASEGATNSSNRAVIYPSEEYYELRMKALRLRNAIHQSVRNDGLRKVQLKQLEQFASILGIDTDTI